MTRAASDTMNGHFVSARHTFMKANVKLCTYLSEQHNFRCAQTNLKLAAVMRDEAAVGRLGTNYLF